MESWPRRCTGGPIVSEPVAASHRRSKGRAWAGRCASAGDCCLSAVVARAGRARYPRRADARAPGTCGHSRTKLQLAREHVAARVRHRAAQHRTGRAARLGHRPQRHAAAPDRARAGGTFLHHAALPHRARLHHSDGARCRPLQSLAALVAGIGGCAVQYLQHERCDLRHRHPRLCLHLLSHLHGAAVGRRIAGGVGPGAGCRPLDRHPSHQSAARCPGHHRWRAARGGGFAGAVWTAGDPRHAGAASCSCRPASTGRSAAILHAGARRQRCLSCSCC